MLRIITIILFCLGANVMAADSIKVSGVWGFAVGSTQGTYFRAILDQANQEQNKYEFQFDHRPGAGGAIATRYVNDQKTPAILAHSAAYFVRPYLYPDTPYNFNQFKPLLIMGQAPAVLMTKGKTIEQLLKQPRIVLGTAGTGSSTHLMAETLKKYAKNNEVVMIHYKDTNEAYLAVLGGHIDGTFEFLGDAKAKATADVTFAGITGRTSIEGIATLKDKGMQEMENLSGIFAIYVPVAMPDSTYKELRDILLRAEQHSSVQTLYRKDYTFRDPNHQNANSLKPWYDTTVKKFQSLTTGIEIK